MVSTPGSAAARAPSSSTTGFFQERPRVENQFVEDGALRRVLGLYLPSHTRHTISPDLSRFGALVLSRQVLDWVGDAEKTPPFVRTWDAFGGRKDELVTSEGWRQLQALGQAEGIVAIPYENRSGEFSRVHQFLKYHIWTASAAYVTCPSAMTDGAARLLTTHLANPALPAPLRPILSTAVSRLTSRDPVQAWTSGQWMTERIGGSDVSNTETLATPSPNFVGTDATGAPLGPWTINGFKWFSSATDAQMTILLARTPDDKISAFYAPTRRSVSFGPKPNTSVVPDLTPYHPWAKPNSATSTLDTELNGIRIQRLKSKLGTRALPTAELELSGLQAHLIGKQGDGIKQISTVLNITRVHNAVTALGLWGRGLAISRAFARVRKVGGKLLADTPAHMRTLAAMEVEYRGYMHLTYFVVLLLGVSEQESQAKPAPRAVPATSIVKLGTPTIPDLTPYSPWTTPQSQVATSIEQDPPSSITSSPSNSPSLTKILPTKKDAQVLLRVLTPVIKALTAKASIAGLSECMESLGGVGYLENEEMEFNIARLARDANVLSIWEGTTDIMATDLVKVLKGRQGAEALAVLQKWAANAAPGVMDGRLGAWITRVKNTRTDELIIDGREIMLEIGRLVASILIVVDCEMDGDETVREIAGRWISRTRGGPKMSAGQQVEWDRRIVFGSVSSVGVVSSKL